MLAAEAENTAAAAKAGAAYDAWQAAKALVAQRRIQLQTLIDRRNDLLANPPKIETFYDYEEYKTAVWQWTAALAGLAISIPKAEESLRVAIAAEAAAKRAYDAACAEKAATQSALDAAVAAYTAAVQALNDCRSLY